MLIQLIVFLTSLTILCYEIILTRIFSITQWQNLSSIIISLALLGFGASGTIIFIYRDKIFKKFDHYLLTFLSLYPLTMCVGFIVYCKIPFNPFEVGIDNKQIFYLLGYLLSMGIPFLMGAAVIGMALTRFSVDKTYFSNLVGSAVGALLIILLSHVIHPFEILLVITITAFMSPIIFSYTFNPKKAIKMGLISIIIISVFFMSFDYLKLKKISQYKALSRTMTLPKAKIIHQRYSPLALVQVVEAEGLRSTVGLSFISPYPIPIQKGIFFDGGAMSSITPFEGKLKDIRYLDYIQASLPYKILKPSQRGSLLIIGVGGGEGILKGILNDFDRILGLEINRDVIDLMKNELADFSGNIYNLDRVKIVEAEARGYLKETEQKFDLIDISTIDSYAAASSGIYALNESYLYTVESIQDMISCLDRGGLLSITRWNSTPPRNNIKLFNMCVEALKNAGIKNPGKHLIFIRSIQASTIVVFRNELSESRINRARKFCNTRLFDLVYYPGIEPTEANRYAQLKEPIYYQAAIDLLSDNNDEFEERFVFDIEPATDNRPYFYNFFKPKTLGLILKEGPRKIPFTQWGYLVLILILIPVGLVSFFLIILPMLWRKQGQLKLSGTTIAYFSLLGIGFFFIEMPLIQKLILFLSHPTYSLSVVISSILFFSGVGSYYSGKVLIGRKDALYPAVIVTLIALFYLVFMDSFLVHFIYQADAVKILITILLIMPLSFFMGFPFPGGLTHLKKVGKNLVPWAWSINGFFSVISIIGASLLSIIFGFKVVLSLACVCYLFAGVISTYWEK